MLFLPARIDARAAAQSFWRPRARNLFGLWRHAPVKRAEDGLPASLELVWMPAYAFRFRLTRAGKKASAWVSVDASHGGFAMFERRETLTEATPEGLVGAPVLDQEAAAQAAREGMIRYILRTRDAKPRIEAIEEMLLYHYPVWVFYFRRLANKIDLAVRDGYTGDACGGRVRIAVLDAIIRHRRERLAPPEAG